MCEQFSTQPTHTHTHTRCTYAATVAPESGLRPHSWGGCIIVTGFRSLAVKQFHAVNRKCNRRRVSILVSRQFTRHTKDNALQDQFLPMRTLSPLTQADCLFNILLCVSCSKKDFKSVEVNRIQDCGQILNLCSPGAAYAASPQWWGGLLQYYYFKSSSLKPLGSHFFKSRQKSLQIRGDCGH